MFLLGLLAFPFERYLELINQATIEINRAQNKSPLSVYLFFGTKIAMLFSLQFWEISISGQEGNLETSQLSLLDSLLSVVEYYGVC